MSWQNFIHLPHVKKLSIHEQMRQYNIYNQIVAEEQMAHVMMQNQLGSGTSPVIQQEESPLPSGCIQFVNNTSDGTQCRFWIETSAPTNYTITWGDGETTTGQTTVGTGAGVGIGDGEDKLEIEYSYSDSNTEYTARICFDDISLVTYLEFNGDD